MDSCSTSQTDQCISLSFLSMDFHSYRSTMEYPYQKGAWLLHERFVVQEHCDWNESSSKATFLRTCRCYELPAPPLNRPACHPNSDTNCGVVACLACWIGMRLMMLMIRERRQLEQCAPSRMGHHDDPTFFLYGIGYPPGQLCLGNLVFGS